MILVNIVGRLEVVKFFCLFEVDTFQVLGYASVFIQYWTLDPFY